MKLLSEKELTQLVHSISIEFFHKPFVDKVKFNNRLRTTGGRYIPAKRLIELNPKYYVEADQDEFIGIIKHELCHYHLHIEGKGYKHRDPEFRALLQKTGSPRHCKPLQSNLNKFNYEYKCTNCHHTYRRVRRVDMKKYRCGICRGRLVEVKNASLIK
ncbi:SprT family protein [Ornithinibacillus sp. BX22]|uniref:Protein SprT-like n=2 Tax=Ornithinibacillus TaxID=484508 RepID=A0A923RK71_9BACI|nr:MULTISPECIES: SprT family protein [Ornithinibacillus]MBC5636997.1 SprT family protein [Ornithinibacillus hominis]MBS3681562.1 SprT family protein [Ornithinibacillus massiliensis]